jgi:DNA-binding PadR family transcriptional regulator
MNFVGTRRLTPLGIAALALLTEGDMHPYEMFQTMIARRDDVIVKLRPGSLYHTVNRLEQDELVESVGTDREGNRPERTTYRITDIGRYALRSEVAGLLAMPAREYPIFPVAVAELDNLQPEEVASHLRNRLSVLERDVAEIRRAQAELTHLERVYLLDIDYLATMREAEIAWVNRLLNEIETKTLTWEPEARRRANGERE